MLEGLQQFCVMGDISVIDGMYPSRMSQHIQRLAIALWLMSLAAPASTLQNGTIANGAQIVIAGVLGMAFMFPIGLLGAPLVACSLLSNLLVLGELWLQVCRPLSQRTFFGKQLLIAAAALNVAMGHHLARLLPDALSHPGFYLWSSSFVLLASVAVHEERLFFAGLLKRSLALGAVAAVVFFAGLAAILLSH